MSSRRGSLFKNISQEKIDHMVLYFHGGLVPEGEGLKTAETLYSLFADRVKAHPLFFIWESGWLDVIKNNLSSLTNTPLFKELMRGLLKFTLSKLESLANGAGSAIQ